jgi:putative membrane protein
MILIPIVRWVVGDRVLHWGVMLSVSLQAAAVLAVLVTRWGVRETLRLAAIIIPAAWLIEWVGSHTGFPFGEYDYTALLRPQLGGVPLIIPTAWLMMLPPAWAVADWINGEDAARASRRRSQWLFVTVSALAFTAWDLFLDPQMVAWGYWVWEQPGAYFGIPVVNYAGWLLSAALLTLIVRPAINPSLSLLVIYTITWALQSIGLALFWGMPGPALAGFLGMGVFVLLAWRARMRQPSTINH